MVGINTYAGDRFEIIIALQLKHNEICISGKSWQETYGTDDRLEVESFLTQQGIQYKWKEDSSLYTERAFQATIRHPVTDRQAWFNHAHLFHPSDLPKDSYDALCQILKPEDMPKYVTYADGKEIPVEHLRHIR